VNPLLLFALDFVNGHFDAPDEASPKCPNAGYFNNRSERTIISGRHQYAG
jgi:hypothetical protein